MAANKINIQVCKSGFGSSNYIDLHGRVTLPVPHCFWSCTETLQGHVNGHGYLCPAMWQLNTPSHQQTDSRSHGIRTDVLE